MPEDYAELRKPVEGAGFFTTVQPIGEDGDRIVCASRRTGRGLGGNSFWVAKWEGDWFIATWAPRYYRLARPERFAELCVRLLSREPETAYGFFDESIQREFELMEVDVECI